MKFIMFITVKMPTIVGILTLSSMLITVKMPTIVGILIISSIINTTSEIVSGYRCVSDCRSRGREFDPSPVPYFRGD